MTVEKLKREDMDELDIALRASNAVPEEDYALLKKMHGRTIAECLKMLDEEIANEPANDDTSQNNTEK
jgi:hypothetical protein